jgi:hypothetical protein
MARLGRDRLIFLDSGSFGMTSLNKLPRYREMRHTRYKISRLVDVVLYCTGAFLAADWASCSESSANLVSRTRRRLSV